MLKLLYLLFVFVLGFVCFESRQETRSTRRSSWLRWLIASACVWQSVLEINSNAKTLKQSHVIEIGASSFITNTKYQKKKKETLTHTRTPAKTSRFFK